MPIPYPESPYAGRLWTPEVRLELRAQAAPRLNVVLPHFYRNWAFGGIASAMELSRVLSAPYAQVRFVSLAPLGQPEETWDFARAVADPANTAIEAASVHDAPLDCHQADIFLSTWWKTALLWLRHNELLEAAGLDPNPGCYFIQDWEPGFYPFGVEHCQVLQTYSRPELTHAIFNSLELAGYFKAQGYAFSREYALPVCLNPVLRARLDQCGWRLKPKPADQTVFLVYGRPQEPRNCFPALAEGLHRFVQRLAPEERRGLVLLSAGREHEDLILADGLVLKSLGKLSLERYAATLELAHAGVALMASPHPSYPPLEMAAFGLYTITNAFANKNLKGAHPLLRSLPFPEPEALARELGKALAFARDARKSPRKAVLPGNMSQAGLYETALAANIEPIVGPGRRA